MHSLIKIKLLRERKSSIIEYISNPKKIKTIKRLVFWNPT